MTARLEAQRVVLAWLLSRADAEKASVFLRERAQRSLPPPDQQEDPGAVPTEAFAPLAAFGDELESLMGLVSEMADRQR